MKLDVNGKEYSVGSSAQTNLNTVLGSLGAASFLGMGANNGCGGGGILGGIFGNNCGGNSCVNQREGALALALSEARARETALELARQEDAKIADVLKQTNAGLIEVANGVSRNDVRLSCLEEKVQWIREESARNLREAKEYADHLVACEAKERQAADQNILAYTNGELAKKINGELVIGGDQIRYGGCQPVLCNTNCLGTKSNPVFLNSTDADVTAITQAVLAAIKASQTPA